jgi:hypothetical protein
MSTAFTADEIRRLPSALTVIQAARLLRIGRSSAYPAVMPAADSSGQTASHRTATSYGAVQAVPAWPTIKSLSTTGP